MLSLEQLQKQRDQIIQGMMGARSVGTGDRSMTFVSPDEANRQLARIDAEIARLQGTAVSRVFTIQTNRGL